MNIFGFNPPKIVVEDRLKFFLSKLDIKVEKKSKGVEDILNLLAHKIDSPEKLTLLITLIQEDNKKTSSYQNFDTTLANNKLMAYIIKSISNQLIEALVIQHAKEEKEKLQLMEMQQELHSKKTAELQAVNHEQYMQAQKQLEIQFLKLLEKHAQEEKATIAKLDKQIKDIDAQLKRVDQLRENLINKNISNTTDQLLNIKLATGENLFDISQKNEIKAAIREYNVEYAQTNDKFERLAGKIEAIGTEVNEMESELRKVNAELAKSKGSGFPVVALQLSKANDDNPRSKTLKESIRERKQQREALKEKQKELMQRLKPLKSKLRSKISKLTDKVADTKGDPEVVRRAVETSINVVEKNAEALGISLKENANTKNMLEANRMEMVQALEIARKHLKYPTKDMTQGMSKGR